MKIPFKALIFTGLFVVAGTFSLYSTSIFQHDFQIEDITSEVPYRKEWELHLPGTENQVVLSAFLDQPFSYLGEGGQSYAFVSADGKYVLKFFKFHRFRPSKLFSSLPNIPPFDYYIERHAARRENKLQKAFTGYQLAFKLHNQESGLLYAQLNPLSNPLYARILTPQGNIEKINLQHSPFVIQKKGEMLSDSMKQQLDSGNVEGCKNLIDKLFTLYRVEHAKGLLDQDRGLMHNIGVSYDQQLFHLDVGKFTYTENIKTPEDSIQELQQLAFKLDKWIKNNTREHYEPLHQHIRSHFKDNSWTFTNSVKPKFKECENVFASDLYSEYQRQLITFLHEHPNYNTVSRGTSSLDKDLQLLVGIIENPLGPTTESHRNQHVMFIQQLRKIPFSENFTSASDGSPSKLLFKDLINWIFLQVNLSNSIESYLFQNVPPPVEGEQILNYLKHTQHSLHSQLKGNRKKTAKMLPEDHFLAGNLPLKIASHKVNLIRFAEPLVGNAYLPYSISPPAISPEFLQFVKQQPQHLYINLMRRYGSEGHLTKALENLGLLVNSLNIVSLDKDSDFYWQKGQEFSNPLDTISFKMSFLERLTDPSGNYYWPQNLDLNIWNNQLLKILNEVHQDFFWNQHTLTLAERQDFIELSYCAIINALIETVRPTSMNIACRQSMDRGPSLMTLWLLQQKQIEGSHIAAMLLAPPLIIHQRTIHPPRLARFISAAKRL